MVTYVIVLTGNSVLWEQLPLYIVQKDEKHLYEHKPII